YKKVDRKVKPVPGIVLCRFPENPLDTLPILSPHVPEFVLTSRLTAERISKFNIDKPGFLWPEEEKLFLHILKINERSIAFTDSERGIMHDSYFTLYVIPVVPHVPWKYKNIPIPPG
ncbi:hypothetical protein GY45DRAFT_1208931, partial [Cubamyces sp. BRFM 1775]